MTRITIIGLLLSVIAIENVWPQNVGSPAPDFEITLLSGETFRLSDHPGKVVVLFNFGNACPSCIAYGPDIEEKLHQDFKADSSFLIIGLDIWDGSSSAVTSFRNRSGITFPLGLDGSSVAKLYNTTYDRLLVIDKEGILQHKGTVVAISDLQNAVRATEAALAVVVADPCDEADINIAGSISHPSCPGASDGTIDVTVSGNYPEFDFEWSTNVPGEDQSDLEAGTYSISVTDSEGCTASADFILVDPDALVLGEITGSLDVHREETFFYSVDAPEGLDIQWTVDGGNVVSGQGTASVEIQWDQVKNGSVMATAINDAGCVSNEASLEGIIVDLCVSADIEITASLVHPTCYGGSDGGIDVTVTGNHPEYDYDWSTDVAGEDQSQLNAGSYSLTVTDSEGCKDSAVYTLVDPEAVVLGEITGLAEVNLKDTFLYSVNAPQGLDIQWTVDGGSVVSGQGTTSVEIQWDKVSDGSVMATAITEAGCVSNEVSLEGIVADLCVSADIVITGSVTHPSCQGEMDGVIDVTVTGNHPNFEYDWSTDVSGEDQSELNAGTYSLIVTDSAACIAHAEFTLEDPEAVVLGDISGFHEVSPIGTFSYSIEAPEGLDIQWTIEDGSLVSGQGTSMVEVQWSMESMGTLSAVATTEAACMSDEVSLEVSIESAPTSVQSDTRSNPGVYPNPVKDILFVDSPEEVRITIFDMNGRVKLSVTGRQANLSFLEAGLYTVKLDTVDQIGMYRILKQ